VSEIMKHCDGKKHTLRDRNKACNVDTESMCQKHYDGTKDTL
jgi:hypothetical protein